MSLETRVTGKYYYRRYRVNGRLRADYVGCGADAEAAAHLDAKRSQRIRTERDRRRREQAADLASEKQTTLHCDQLQAIAGGLLEQWGLHQHHGTWRIKQ